MYAPSWSGFTPTFFGPTFFRRRGGCGAHFMHRGHGHGDEGFEGGGGFGVRRPLRFMAHKLDLNEKQITELARILDELKTEARPGGGR